MGNNAVVRCACLLEQRDDAVLLVRVRDNALWYLPGGTIEAGETAEEALAREIAEELSVIVELQSVVLDRQIVGPAYGRDGLVELNCYRARWSGTLLAMSEVSEIGWFGPGDRERVAPAIKLLFDELWPDGGSA